MHGIDVGRCDDSQLMRPGRVPGGAFLFGGPVEALLPRKLPRYTTQLQVRMTALQRAMLVKAAELEHSTLSRFVRSAALVKARRLFKKGAGG